MAEVWLNQNVSNWNTPTAWYYWDEDTQSAQPYGRNPQAGDVVYLNGYQINANSPVTFLGKVTNGLNPHTNRSGGRFDGVYGGTFQFTEIEVVDVDFMHGATNNAITISFFTQNINLIGTGLLYTKGSGNLTVNISGNIIRSSHNYLCGGGSGTVTYNITGNVASEHTLTSASATTTIVGNLSVKNAPINTLGTLIVNGNVVCENTYLFSGTSATINGNVQYTNYEPLKGFIRATTINVPDTFEITRTDDIGITAIFTKYTMNNRQQYPSEDVVKEGVEYVWGEKVGTYEAPPESVVLKDYVYDNGDKIGTLENEVIVDNTNTINVYPYKRRR